MPRKPPGHLSSGDTSKILRIVKSMEEATYTLKFMVLTKEQKIRLHGHAESDYPELPRLRECRAAFEGFQAQWRDATIQVISIANTPLGSG